MGIGLALVQQLVELHGEMLSKLLEMKGAAVRTASSGAESLRIVNGNQFDVIISAVSMPEMDGFKFLRQLRQQPQHQEVPVLALTGFGRRIRPATAN